MSVGGPADAATPPPPKPVKVEPVKVAKPKPVKKSKGHTDAGIGGTAWGDLSASEAASALDAAGVWGADRDQGSLWAVTSGSGAQAAWAKGLTGKDVTVAVIDTGIAPVAGLDGNDKVVNGPDLSFDGQSTGTRYVDGYGHGTHMAGIIAGHDDGFDPKHPDATGFAGVAPDAQLLNMKVGAADGGADVSQVIAALDWVTEHRKDHGMNVRVVNLAYGTASVQPWQVDPLARAVENAWNAGLVVVTAAGNDGLDAASLLMPAVDPHILAVGAVDNEGTSDQSDDVVAAFTNGGNATRRPDVLAPGKSVVSLRVPGSYVDTEHPEGLVTGDVSGRFFRGSGTSQATAVASGEIALLLQARPGLTPDQVKALLISTADPLVAHPDPAMGAGVTDVAAALMAKVPSASAGAGLPDGTGTGSLEASRGGEHVIDPANGDVLSGEVDALGSPWNSTAWAAASAKRDTWSGGAWNGRVWAGKSWAKDDWAAATWTGASWSGLDWATHPWSDASWQARSWRNRGWAARSWREKSWQARSWRSLSGTE
ncbi:S8 family serine peptidase [Nocardioides panacis]|uniref:S8 family serine peptidase n=1 Tax=Nocardioides panacis TaxID=2849501 RepID=A0A975T1V4_9ACTN|nr:S8 family serine peptidase [Nocardioides panacis]QWZ10075.1 S8 family serine peptidase [Nocardioides panacis]